jgi:hypothetical protein
MGRRLGADDYPDQNMYTTTGLVGRVYEVGCADAERKVGVLAVNAIDAFAQAIVGSVFSTPDVGSYTTMLYQREADGTRYPKSMTGSANRPQLRYWDDPAHQALAIQGRPDIVVLPCTQPAEQTMVMRHLNSGSLFLLNNCGSVFPQVLEQVDRYAPNMPVFQGNGTDIWTRAI